MLTRIAFASFGRPEPIIHSRVARILLVLMCGAFVLLSALIAISLNVFALLAGIWLEFIGRDGLRVRYLKIGPMPAILIALPVLFGFVLWRESQVGGLWASLWPMFAVGALGALLLGAAAAWGWRKSKSRRLMSPAIAPDRKPLPRETARSGSPVAVSETERRRSYRR